MITAATDVDTVRSAMRGGVLHYLIKPFDYAALRDQLAHFASLRERLHRLGSAGQADVDQVFGARPTSKPLLPKGLTPETARLVETALKSHPEGLSASECASSTGVSHGSARAGTWSTSCRSGRAEVRLRYGGTGRPERIYAASPRTLSEPRPRLVSARRFFAGDATFLRALRRLRRPAHRRRRRSGLRRIAARRSRAAPRFCSCARCSEAAIVSTPSTSLPSSRSSMRLRR